MLNYIIDNSIHYKVFAHILVTSCNNIVSILSNKYIVLEETRVTQ